MPDAVSRMVYHRSKSSYCPGCCNCGDNWYDTLKKRTQVNNECIKGMNTHLDTSSGQTKQDEHLAHG
jgi:hypothetical protein